MSKEEELMRDIVGYAKKKMMAEYGCSAMAILPDKFAQVSSTTKDGKDFKVEITLK